MTWKHIKKEACPHLKDTPEIDAQNKTTCAACGETADLRVCLSCGYIACCESHKAHNTEHFKATGHPLIKPHHCGYNWLWCYKCAAFLDSRV